MNWLRRLFRRLLVHSPPPSRHAEHAAAIRRLRRIQRRQRIFEEQFRVDSATRRGEQG